MPNVGISGSLYQSKKKWKSFGDRKGDWKKRKEIGQYGVDTSSEGPSAKGIISHDFNIGIGEYDFGKGKIELSSKGFSFSVATNNSTKVIEINRNFSELTKEAGFDTTLIESLRDSLYKSRLNFDINDIRLKDIQIEGPGAALGASISTEMVGAKATTQLASLKITLETPLGDISAKLKAGMSFGSEVGLAQTKLGKIGIKRAQNLSFGLWEIALTPTQQAEQSPSLFEWSEFGAASQSDLFSSIPADATAKLFQPEELSCRLDFDELSELHSADASAESEPQFESDIEWEEYSDDIDSSSQNDFSELPETLNTVNFAEIPSTSSVKDARSILVNNLKQLNLEDTSASAAIETLDLDQIRKANQDLIVLSKQQAEIIKNLLEQQNEQNQNEALTRLNQGAEGFQRFGQQTGCRAFEMIGNLIKFTTQVIQVIKAFQKTKQDAEALGNIFAPLAALAPLGAIGVALGAFSVLLGLMSSSSIPPDRTAIIIAKVDELLRGQEDIVNLINTVRYEQANLLRVLRQDILALRADLQERLSAIRIEFTEAFEKIDNSINFLSKFTHIAARNQYLQNFKHCCVHTKQLNLKQGREADILTRNLESILLSDATNEILTGLAEQHAGLPQQEQARILENIFSADMAEEIRDQHLNFLLGYFYQQEMINPLIWQQAAQQYIYHTQRFFALYMEDSDKTLNQIIGLGGIIEEDWRLLESSEQHQKLIDNYYEALKNVQARQHAVFQQFNTVRRQYYNQDYTKEALGQAIIAQLDFFDLPQTLLQDFEVFDEDEKKFLHSFKHLHPNQVGKHPATLQATFNLYPGKNQDTVAARSFDLNLSLIAEKLKEVPAEGSSARTTLNYLLCAEYLKLIGLSVETEPLSYPDIPVAKSKNEAHAHEIVRANKDANSHGSPGRYFLAQENEQWMLDIDINYGDRNCDLILSASLPREDELETLLKEANSAYVLSNYSGQERLYYLSKYPREFTQIFGVKEEYIRSLRQNTIVGAVRRKLTGRELEHLLTYQRHVSTIKVHLSGDYTNFNTNISGIEEDNDGYREPDVLENSFHKKMRAAIPSYLEQNWLFKKPKITIVEGEEEKLRQKIEQKFLEERKLLLLFISSGKADDPQLQACLQAYHAALLDLDIACNKFKAHAHLAGKKLQSELINSQSILKEIYDNYQDLTITDVTPTLTQACALTVEERSMLTDFIDLEKLSNLHPKRLLQETIFQLKLHKRWRDLMRKSYPWLNYKDVQQYWTMKIYSSIERMREELYVHYTDLKNDVSGYANATARLHYVNSAPVTTSVEYQKVYNAIHDWTLIQAKNPPMTGYLRNVQKSDLLEQSLDYIKLKRGWSANIAFLLQYAADSLGTSIDIENVVNFELWCDGSIHFCKLLDIETGPYKNGRDLAAGVRLTWETQIHALENMESAGHTLNSAITMVAFSEKLFQKLFDRYLAVFDKIKIIIEQSANETDYDIVQTMLSDDFPSGSQYKGIFLQLKEELNIAAILIKNYLNMAFNDTYDNLFVKTIINGEVLEAKLRKLLTEPNAKDKAKPSILQKLQKQLRAKAKYFKDLILETICFNRSLSYFSQKLERYHDEQTLSRSDTLFITHEFLLKGSSVQDKIPFTLAHLDLLDQFLKKNPHIKAISFWGIEFNEELLSSLVLLLKDSYPYIDKLTIAAANIVPNDLCLLKPILPQLKHLDLRSNLLGDDSEDISSHRYTYLLPFIESCYSSQLNYLGLAQNDISEMDIAAINAGFLLLPVHEIKSDFNLDLTNNPAVPSMNIGMVKFINDPVLTVENIKPATVESLPKAVTLKPQFEFFGQPMLGQALVLLTKTKKILYKQSLSANYLSQIGIHASSAAVVPTASSVLTQIPSLSPN